MKGCRTIAEYAIKKWMEDNGFVMEYFTVEMCGNESIITDKTGESMKVSYKPEIKKVEVKDD